MNEKNDISISTFYPSRLRQLKRFRFYETVTTIWTWINNSKWSDDEMVKNTSKSKNQYYPE